jgi:hypothetical protein
MEKKHRAAVAALKKKQTAEAATLKSRQSNEVTALTASQSEELKVLNEKNAQETVETRNSSYIAGQTQARDAVQAEIDAKTRNIKRKSDWNDPVYIIRN